MKTIFFSIIILMGVSLSAQIAPILDHVWTIEQIDTGDQIIPADPNPLGEDESFNPAFSFDLDNLDYYYTLYAQCEYYLSFDDSNSQLYHHLQGCALATGEISEIAYYFNYIFIQDNTNINTTDFNNNFTSFGPLSYNFSTSGDIIYLHITNTVGEIATFFANNLSQEQFLKDVIATYPNPVLDVLSIEISGVTIDHTKIYDLNGRLLQEHKINSENQINVSQLPKGIYILHIETAVGSLSKKLIKE